MMGKELGKEIEENIDKVYDLFFGYPQNKLQEIIDERLSSYGLMYRTFARVKTKASIKKKIALKYSKYVNNNLKMQDVIGIRIVLYFKDDINICISILKKLFEVDNFEHDTLDTETFKPQRINYVFRIPEDVAQISDELSDKSLIDKTFEVQIRTIFSEGWHEVEHDIRYKYLEDWKGKTELSRELNGIFAALEMCDNNILSICEKLAYESYKNNQWESMIRNKFRIRFEYKPLRKEICEILDKNRNIAKVILRYDRKKLMDDMEMAQLPKTCDNIVYLINELHIYNSFIKEITPEILKRRIQKNENKLM